MASRSSCGPAPTCEPAPAGPHCFGGGALVEVRRPCWGLRLGASLGAGVAASLPRTFAARPWIADHEFPHSPVSALDVSRVAFDVCAPADLTNDDDGPYVAWRRGDEAAPLCAVAAGDAALEPSLPSVA